MNFIKKTWLLIALCLLLTPAARMPRQFPPIRRKNRL